MKRQTLTGLSGLAVVIVAVFAIIRLGDMPRFSEATDYLMDTVVTVKVYAPASAHADETISRAFTEAKRLELLMNPLGEGGELNRIDEGGPGAWWVISPELEEVLSRAAHFYEVTQGAFDPTIAAVKWLWDFDGETHLPAAEEIAQALRTVGFENVEIRGDSLNLGVRGTKLDLGGIAKGYIVDRMVRILREGGATSCLVNAGGDIYLFGQKAGGDDWVIGFRHPRNGETIVLETMPLPAVATSGDYERYFIAGGRRYHHILDPGTGYPADGCVSVTVWTTTAMDADALATGLFVLGHEKGIALAEKLEDVEALIFWEDDSILRHDMTSGVRGKVALSSE
ncbi:FAD:protein FMN transferase [Candidatus Latescibacterota bacterium]